MEWQQILHVSSQILKSNNTLREINSKKRIENEIISDVLNQTEIRKLLLTWMDKLPKNNQGKCPTKAKQVKKLANKAFKAKHYQESIHFYTKCMMYSFPDSEDYLQAVAYRSASLFYLGAYEESIKDIDLVMKWKCPPKMSFTLNHQAGQSFGKLNNKEQMRKYLTKAKECLQNCDDMSKEQKAKNSRFIDSLTSGSGASTLPLIKDKKPEPAFGENSSFANASAGLCKKTSADNGRFVVTCRDMKKGQILFVERPFAFVLLDHVRFDSVCAHCCQGQLSSQIPCSSCSEVVYCGKKCQHNAWTNYHQWECSGNKMGLWSQIGIAHLALNVFLTCSTTSNIPRFNQVQSLATNIDLFPSVDLLIYSINAMMLMLYLKTYTDFFQCTDLKVCFVNKFTSKEADLDCDLSTEFGKELYVSSMLLRCTLQMICNGHAITGLNSSDSGESNIRIEQQDRIATAIYPSASTMNHSCDPNIINSFWDECLIIKATRDIPAGEEVYNCYGPYFRRMPTKERQDCLKNQYCFTCKCEPCTNPKLQNFLDRFTALKCAKCSGAHCQNISRCLDCGTISTLDHESNLENGNHLFEEAQFSLENDDVENALKKAKRCLDIRKNILYKHHDDISSTLDLMGRIYAGQSRYAESIKCLQESLKAVEEKFGNDSIEVAAELNKLTDICIQYLDSERNWSQDKETPKKTLQFLDQALQIMDLCNGPWTPAYREIVEKKNHLLLLSKLHCNLKL